MQPIPGVTCYCCGEGLGTNLNCGDLATIGSAAHKRPPCIWAHTDARCTRKEKPKAGVTVLNQRKDDKEEGHTIFPNGTPVFVPPMVGGYGIRGVVVGWTAESRRYQVQFDGSSRTIGSVLIQKALFLCDSAIRIPDAGQ